MHPKLKIIAVFDNGGETFDRYTVFVNEWHDYAKTVHMCLGMSHNPTDPQGYSQWGSGHPGTHCGKQIIFHQLPEHIQQHVTARLAKPPTVGSLARYSNANRTEG